MKTIRWYIYRLGVSTREKGERTGKVWLIRLGYILMGRVY